jgi:hypothetical protein
VLLVTLSALNVRPCVFTRTHSSHANHPSPFASLCVGVFPWFTCVYLVAVCCHTRADPFADVGVFRLNNERYLEAVRTCFPNFEVGDARAAWQDIMNPELAVTLEQLREDGTEFVRIPLPCLTLPEDRFGADWKQLAMLCRAAFGDVLATVTKYCKPGGGKRAALVYGPSGATRVLCSV